MRLLLARLDPELAAGWSDEEVMRRWGGLFPPRDKSRQALPISNDWVKWRLKDAAWVAKARQRLQNLCWFMTCLKEPLSRRANRQEQTRGAFFEGPFKSVAMSEVAAIFDRFWSSAETWPARLAKLSRGRLFGRFFAASRQRLREVAERLGLRRVPNLGGCTAT